MSVEAISHVPVLVEYRPYEGLSVTTTILTDVSVKDVIGSGQTFCEVAIEYCRAEGLDVTGNATISTYGIWAPKKIDCPFKENCRTIDFGSPCPEIETCSVR